MNESEFLAAAEAFLDGKLDEETYAQFPLDFASQRFVVDAVITDQPSATGKQPVQVKFQQLEGVDLPVLVVRHLPSEKDEANIETISPEPGKIEFLGVMILQIIGQKRFHLAFGNASTKLVFDYDKLVFMRRMIELNAEVGTGETPLTAEAPNQARIIKKPEWPELKKLYAYFASQPSIQSCWVGFLYADLTDSTDLAVIVDAADFDRHSDYLKQLIEPKLKPQQLFVVIQRSVPGSYRDTVNMLLPTPPFYSKSHPQSAFAKFFRSLKPKQLFYVRMEITRNE